MSTKHRVRGPIPEGEEVAGGGEFAIENRPQECARIVKRLLERIDRHVGSLAKSNFTLSWEEMQQVLLALESEADGVDPKVHLDGGDEISAYVRRSLFDELVGEPSNIFYTTQLDTKTVRYNALPKDFWKECLALLRKSLEELRGKV